MYHRSSERNRNPIRAHDGTLKRCPEPPNRMAKGGRGAIQRVLWPQRLFARAGESWKRSSLLRCDASGLLQSAVDADGIKRALTGTSAQDARTYLQQLSGLAAPPSVDMSPPWAPRAFRIDVNVQGPK